MSLINGDTWNDHPRLKKISELKRDPKHACMFIFQESTGKYIYILGISYNTDHFEVTKLNITNISASRGGNYSIGRQLNITDGVRLSDLDEFDQLVIQKVEHSGGCWQCRRWLTTLKLFLKLLKNDAFWGVLAEYLKVLASSFCRSK